MIDSINTKDTSVSALHNDAQEFVKLRGNVRIIVDDEEKGRYVHFDDHNIIVNGAKNIMANQIAYGSTLRAIKGLALGKGRSGWDILNPPAPDVNQTELFEEVIFLTPTTQGGISVIDGTAKFTFILEKGQGNGSYDGGGTVAYTEAGLYAVGAPTASGVLFAYETYPALVKNSTRQITFEWSIIF